MIAALFVDVDGIYAGRPDVDCWDVARDARTYAGPYRVVAHPPCERWGSLWAMGRKRFGDDAGCFAAALASLERWGGVLEHPASSGAWPTFGLPVPSREGGWTRGARGWSAHVEQGHYGHRARKPTWLYYVGPEPPPLVWGPSPQRGVWVAHGAGMPAGYTTCGKRERRSTPEPFAALLLSLATVATRAEVSRAGACVADQAARSCRWCGAPMSPGTRPHALTCSKRCRQARQRWLLHGRPEVSRNDRGVDDTGSVVELALGEPSRLEPDGSVAGRGDGGNRRDAGAQVPLFAAGAAGWRP